MLLEFFTHRLSIHAGHIRWASYIHIVGFPAVLLVKQSR